MNGIQMCPKVFIPAEEQACLDIEEPPGIRKPSLMHKAKELDGRNKALAAAYRYILAQEITSSNDHQGEIS